MPSSNAPDLRKFKWMQTRIPIQDALVAFVAEGDEPNPVLLAKQKWVGFSRWFPVDGGHCVLIPYDGREYDECVFSIEPGGWDHEHCKVCREPIPAMTLCYNTEPGQPYILLCVDCYEQHAKPKGWFDRFKR